MRWRCIGRPFEPENLMADDTKLETRGAFAHLSTIDTRWMDNDAYGHVNNVVYYSFFDTAVNRWLIERGLLDVAASPAIGLVVETQCRYFAPITFPDRVTAGLRVARLGRSSVRYEIGLFRNDDVGTAAVGHFVHVYVDRATRTPVAIPDAIRSALADMVLAPSAPREPISPS
jgi:acyl-CoA thioester hydrolase